MAKISDLSDDLLVKILSFLPTKLDVSTSVLSKQYEFIWMWLPKLEYDDYNDITDHTNPTSCMRYRDFINKNLPLHRAPIIESLCLRFCLRSLQPDIKSWAGIAVSRCVRELSVRCSPSLKESAILLPISLYTCKSLVTLKLIGKKILVDVPQVVCLPSVKTMQFGRVTYANEDSLRLLLSYCHVLEDLNIQRDDNKDNVRALVVIVPSLKRLSLRIGGLCSSDDGTYVIVAPSLKYFKVVDYRETFSYLIEHLPELEEANIVVEQNPEKFLKSITCVRRLSLQIFNSNKESLYQAGVVFNKLEYLKLRISDEFWSRLLLRLLKDSPKLRVLNLDADRFVHSENYEPESRNSEQSFVPECLLKSLEIFEFAGYKGREEEKDFLSYISKHARCLKSSSILP